LAAVVSRCQKKAAAIHEIDLQHGHTGRIESLDQVDERADELILTARPTRSQFQSKRAVYLLNLKKWRTFAKNCLLI
jgi:hypothetical protein